MSKSKEALLVGDFDQPVSDSEARHVQYLESEIARTQAYLERLTRQLSIARSGSYAGEKIKTSIYRFLDGRGAAATKKEIESALEAGGAVLGKRQGAAQIGKSLDRLLRAKRLRMVGEKVGRAEWTDEKF